MRRDGRDHRAWQRKKPTGPDEQLVLDEVNRRTLSDLEQCRIAWEHNLDPLALCEAVSACDPPLWLKDALLVHLSEVPEGDKGLLPSNAWAKRTKDQVDLLRATTIARMRTLTPKPQTWEGAFTSTKRRLRGLGEDLQGVLGDVDEDALKKSYQRVRRGLLDNSGRYFRLTEHSTVYEQIRLAWRRLRGLRVAHREIEKLNETREI